MAEVQRKPGAPKPGTAVGLYALFATLWIILTGAVLSGSIDDPERVAQVEIVKGLVFVAATSVLLYLLLSSWRDQAGARPDSASAPRAAGRPLELHRLLLIFIVLLLAVPLLGYAIVRLHGPHLEQEVYAELKAIAELKAEQLDNWLSERRRDGRTLAEDPGFVDQVEALRGQARADSGPLVDRLEAFRRSYEYTSVSVVDPQGEALVHTGAPHQVPRQVSALLGSALDNETSRRCLLCRDRRGRLHLDFVVPLVQAQGQPRAAVLMHVDPRDFILPFIQRWPTASPSGETLLVRREGQQVVFLNEVRHHAGEPLQLTLPVDREDLPAGKALRSGGTGTVQGRDYRGVSVLAAYMPVPGTDWQVIAKLDREEVLAPLKDLVLWVTLLALFAVAAVSFAVLLVWRQQLRLHGLELQAEKSRSERALRHFFELPFIGMGLLSGGTRSAGWLQFNDRLAEILGYPPDELIEKTWMDLTHPEDIAPERSEFDSMEAGASDGFTREKRFICKSGSIIDASVDVKCVRDATGGVEYYLATVDDITERKENEARILRLSRMYAILAQANQAMVQCPDEAALLEQLCRVAVEHGGLKMAWVGRLDREQETIRPVAWYGTGVEYVKQITITTSAEEPTGRGPAGTAVREGRPVWSQDFLHEASTAPWHAAAEQFGYASAGSIPLRRDNAIIGVLNLYAGEPEFFEDATQRLLADLGADISYALDNFERDRRRREAEQRLALVIEGSSDAPWDWDLARNEIWYSPQWWRMLGYEVDTSITDPELWRRLAHPEDVDQVDEAFNRIVQPGNERDAVECRFRHQDGHYVPTLIRGVASTNEAGETVRLSGTVMDLTQQKRIESELSEQVEELRRWYDATLGREERVVNLKQEINELLSQLGQPPRYPSAEPDDDLRSAQ